MAPRTEEQFESIREKSKGKIIMAAMQLFSTEGYLSTSMAQIAKQAGVSKGLLYNYFDGKESILMSILNQALEDGEQIMQVDEEVPPKQHLKNIIHRFFAYARESVGFYRMIFPIAFQVHKFPAVQKITDFQREKHIGDMIRIFTEIGYEDPELEAWTVAALTDGIMMHLIALEDTYPLERIEQHLYKKYNLD